MGEVIVVTSGKGGVGKTTTTANLGAALALTGKKVALVDTDIGLRNLDVVMGLENRIVYDICDVEIAHITGEPMVGNTVLREVIGAHSVAAIARADLTFALGRNRRLLLCLLGLIELGAEYLHRSVLVFILAALVLAIDDNSGRQVRYPYCTLGLVYMLAACA